ncbi:MAG: hypothetical protein JJU07_15210 [Natronohydrobacter sp.]|nr:hypothetical protein [Natronohydrobacter sp.]
MGLQSPTFRTKRLSAAHLRAFLHGASMKPGRPDILRHPPDDIAQALAKLPSQEAARCLALLPAGAQIAVVARLDRDNHARLVHDCAEWVCAVPILRKDCKARHNSSQITPLGRL